MKKLSFQDQNALFWYFLIPSLIALTLFISFSPWLLEWLATPSDRVFSGINRWSTDYFIYLSYVEQGRRGLLPVKLLLTTVPHPALFSHLVYTIPGFVFGHLLGLSSVFIYHLFRALYGLIFLWASIIFFYKLSKSKIVTLIAFFLTFYVSGSPHNLTWLQEQNIIGRATGPLHYNVGFIVFIATFLYFFYSKTGLVKKIIVFGIFLNLLLLTNPFNYQLMAFSFVFYVIIKIIICQKNKFFFDEIITIIGGFLFSIPIFFYFYYFLSTKPWGVIGVSPKFYVVTTPPVGFWEAAFSIGPIFFLGIIGMIVHIAGVATKGPPQRGSSLRWPSGFRNKITSVLSKFQSYKNYAMSTGGNEVATGPAISIFLIIWPTIQFLLLLFGNQLKIHPPRAFSGLYYLPLTYFSASFLYRIIRKKSLLFIIYLLLFIITLPNYIFFYKQQLYAFTDFKAFSPFTYPTKKQVEAYNFLEKNTPAGSGVLAMFEASNHLMGYSGNATELDLDHNPKVIFYTNQLTDKQAQDFLTKNRFQYVYFGLQEQSFGGNAENYPFLKKIFENQEVKIYRVL